ncbi:MAG: GDSL-type esterase/lipase family protein [Actinomycetota bacterium]|nr:GDSL-type esterase/lipase family protein [Actinomycetota bacterium]
MTHTRFACTLLATGLVLAACSGDDDAEPVPSSTTGDPTTTVPAETTDTTEAAGPVTIMPLGDSLTEGQADPDNPEEPQSYRGHLHAMLTEAGYDVDLVGSGERLAVGDLPDDPDLDHEGHGGFTIGPDEYEQGGEPGNIDAYLDEWLATPPDVILLLIGVNDLFDEDRPVDPFEADDKLVAVVERIEGLAPEAEILVSSYPPVSYFLDFDNPGTREGAEAFADLQDAIRSVGEEAPDDNVRYVPMFETLEDGWDAETDTVDQLHPSPMGAEKVAQVWFDALTPVLDGN